MSVMRAISERRRNYFHYMPVDGIGTLVAAKRLEAGATYYQYPVYDHRGSVVRLLDENGAPTAYYEYDAWGNELKDQVLSGTASNRFRYQSNWIELKDSGGELYLSPTRLYHAGVGRFLGRDARGSADGGYDYVGQKVVRYVDTDGLGEADGAKKEGGGKEPPKKPEVPKKPEPFKPRPIDLKKYPRVYAPTRPYWIGLEEPKLIPEEWKENAKKNGGVWPLTREEWNEWQEKLAQAQEPSTPVAPKAPAQPEKHRDSKYCKCWKWDAISVISRAGPLVPVPTSGATVAAGCGIVADIGWSGGTPKQGNDCYHKLKRGWAWDPHELTIHIKDARLTRNYEIAPGGLGPGGIENPYYWGPGGRYGMQPKSIPQKGAPLPPRTPYRALRPYHGPHGKMTAGSTYQVDLYIGGDHCSNLRFTFTVT